MQYSKGQDVELGDQVMFGDDTGIVVCIIEDHKYTQKYPESEWRYLQKGFMAEFQNAGLIHFSEVEGVRLIARCKALS